jgi:hypothetical protein
MIQRGVLSVKEEMMKALSVEMPQGLCSGDEIAEILGDHSTA